LVTERSPVIVSEPALVQLSGVSKIFPVRGEGLFGPKTSVRAVDAVSLTLARNQGFGLVGESGCGKSTLARIVLGLVSPSSGSVLFDGTSVFGMSKEDRSTFRRRVQIVQQNPYGSLNPSFTVRQILWEGYRHNPKARLDRAGHRLNVLMGLVGLSSGYLDRYPRQLSGGQRQRVAIARALTVDPEVLVCDEPTSALDVTVQAQVLNLLVDLQSDFGLTYLFISHDLTVVRYLCDRVAVMYLGRVVEEGPADTIFTTPAHPYTKGLLAASPRLDAGKLTAPPVVGELPDSAHVPTGCSYRTRCPFAMPVCQTVDPAPRLAPSGQTVACHLVEPDRGYAGRIQWS
jgi:peptide/nickel transport system ATP-binding protein